MSEELGELNYTKEEFLNLGASYEDTNQDLRAEIDILTIDDEEDFASEQEARATMPNTYETENEEDGEEIERVENIELEAKFVANRIKQLIDNKFQIYDAKKQEKRDIKYKDIVVLLRSTKEPAPIFEKEILNLGMPVFSDSSAEYLESIEIQTIMSLLKIIDNPLQEIPLVTVMRSSIGGFTDNELVEIRLSDKYDNFYNTILKAKKNVGKALREKIDKFLDNLEMWRKEQEYLSLDELIWKIYNDTGYYNYVGLMTNGELRQANLKMLFVRAKQCESISFKGLFNFINYIEKVKTSSKDMDSAKIIGENDDVIRIMSIHKSKGLEFPVVFLSGTGKQFNMQDLNNKILLHPEIGIGVKYIDYDRQIEYDTLSKQAMKNQIMLETLSEEMRVLYVALTRAKEKLIITGYSTKDKQKELDEIIYKYENLNHIILKKYKTYLDWIKLVYNYNKEIMQELSIINLYSKKEVLKNCVAEKEKEVNTAEQILNKISEIKIDEKEEKNIADLLEYSYKFNDATIVPTKTSVTEIKEMTKDDASREYSIELSTPKFLQKDTEINITNAQKGTLIHLCMQKLDLKKAKYTFDDIKELVEKLESKKIITHKEAEAININKVYQFTKSKIWEEMIHAHVVQREKSFYIKLPAKEIYQKELDESVLVQGVIDLYYINSDDELVLVDFKTDYVENRDEESLINKYRTQLELYKNALEQATKRKVSRMYIYSTYLEKEIEL